MAQAELKRGLGLFGASAILIGYVVGASIFITTGPLAYKTGPALWLTFLIASIPAIFMCFTVVQVGCALPVSGANYVLISRTQGAYAGFWVVCAYVIGMAVVFPVSSYGFAGYLGLFIPGLNPMVTAIGLILFLMIINILGINIAGWVQAVLTGFFLLALLLFGVGALFNINPDNLVPFAPKGFGPVIEEAIPAYFSFVGFMVIVEISEEIKNPGKNIPRVLLIGFFAILIVYGLVAFGLTAVLPWESLEGDETAVATAAATFYPAWLVRLISIGAIFASFTTINGFLATTPRVLLAFGRDRIFPKWMGNISSRFKTPYIAIIIIAAAGIFGVSMGMGVLKYAFISVSAVMVYHLMIAIGVLRLRKKLPHLYERSPVKLKGFWYYFWPIGTIVISIAYLALGILVDPKSLAIFFGLTCLVSLIFFERRWRFEKKGMNIKEVFEKDLDGVLKRAEITE